jgi:hypothetical protein
MEEKYEVDDGVKEGMAMGVVSGMCWLVSVTMGKGRTGWCMGLAANANSQEPMGDGIWHRSMVLVAEIVWVALTDYRGREPGRGLSENVVTKPGRSGDRHESAVQGQRRKTHHRRTLQIVPR